MNHQDYQIKQVKQAAQQLADWQASGVDKLNKHPIIKTLEAKLKTLPAEQRADFGRELNSLKQQLAATATPAGDTNLDQLKPEIDVTAPMDIAQQQPPALLPTQAGSRHPIMIAQEEILSIFCKMGFENHESRQLDNEYYMFDSLNFPANHPARDEYDTFTVESDHKYPSQLVAPAHTSTMQNRILKAQKDKLANQQPIAAVVAGRVFRNEDVDASHDHTFYQMEGIYVDSKVTVAHLIATLKEFVQSYYQRQVEIKIQPFFFPFTEPSFEFAFSCPFCHQKGCKVCGQGWIEILGCGLIHPNVLKEAGIDASKYSGFAFGIGFMRLVMTKYGIEDIRHFGSGKLEFLRQFQ